MSDDFFTDPDPAHPVILPPSMGPGPAPDPVPLDITPPADVTSEPAAAEESAATTPAAPAPVPSAPAQPAQSSLPPGFHMPPSRSTATVSPLPSMASTQTAIPGDLIEVDAHDLGKSEFLKDSGARLRETKVPDKVLKQEETAEQAWRKILSGLQTTDFVHVKLYRRRIDGSYLPLGSRYRMSADEVREIDKLIPWAGKWVLALAHASNRADNESAYRRFTYERGGPEMPEGWSFDGELDLDQEWDMATGREIVESIFQRMQQTPGTPQQQTVTPFGAAPGYPGYPPPGYPPYYPPMSGYAGMPWGGQNSAAEEDRRRREEDERRRRDDEDRRRREEDERRRRDDEEKRRLDETKERRELEEKRDRERRDEREKAEAERKAAEDRHTREMDVLRKLADDARAQAEKTAREWADKFAAEQQRWRDDRDRLERERLDASHRTELTGVTSVVDSLRQEIQGRGFVIEDTPSGARLKKIK